MSICQARPRVLRFSNFRDVQGLSHAVTTRAGGVSEGEYASLNLAYHVGDDADRVTENRKIVAQALGYAAEDLVCSEQVHGAGIAAIDRSTRGTGALSRAGAISGVDALIVTETAIPALIMVADCAPLLLADRSTGVFAVLHAGWRGAVGRIASLTVARMIEDFDSKAENILVGIGPCLCVECFEIGDEVADAARPISAGSVVSGPSKPHLDLRALLAADLRSVGVPPMNVEVMPHCPRCLNELLFSHRGQAGCAGRFGLAAWRD